jgi:hypothetical protein
MLQDSFNRASGPTLKANGKENMMRLLKKIIAAPFVFVAAIIVLLEDWLWDDLARFAAAIGRLPIFHQIEAFIVWLPPYPSLLIFGVPSLLLVPVKFASLYFIAHGRPALGFLIAAAAKVAGTALVARIFNLAKPKLLQIGWFAFVYERFTAFKKRIYDAIKSTGIYKAVHIRYARMKEALKAWKQTRKSVWRKRWDAALRLMRKSKQSQ